MTLYAGADAGGSHTEVVIGARSGEELVRSHGTAARVETDGAGDAARIITAVVHDALEKLPEKETVASLVVGAAGAGSEANRSALQAALVEQRVAGSVDVTTDAIIALESAFPDSAGILLIGGTGSIAYARDPNGDVTRVGGHGWRFGDEGSGYSLGSAAVGAVLKAREGRGPETALTDTVLAGTSTGSANDLRAWAASATIAQIADLARAACDAADSGDSVAAALVEEAGRSLADHVVALLDCFPGADVVDVAMHGGLLVPESAVRRHLITDLTARAPGARALDTRVDPARAALRLAIESARPATSNGG